MEYIIFIFILFSSILHINCELIDKIYSKNININQNVSSYPIVYNKSLNLCSIKNPSKYQIKLGQISGLATSIKTPDQLFIFHRGSRQWTQESFPDGYHFDKNKFGVIPENTILSVDIQTGEVINQWGNKTFFMPHGLFIDNEENIWLTDVAMHQVFKYNKNKLLLTLGELFISGDDLNHFCKPTDVVVSNDNLNIYIADGYCNSRIVKFDSKGKFVKQYLMPYEDKPLIVPHSLILIESLHLLCVADRQNGRIVCFDTGFYNKNDEGKVKAIIKHSSINTIYAITYHSNKHCIYAVSGKNGLNEAIGYKFSVDSNTFGELVSTWKPTDKFGEPHDLVLSVDGRSLFVGEIRPNRIYSFNVLN